MTDPRHNIRDVYPATGTQITAKSWLTEAPLRIKRSATSPALLLALWSASISNRRRNSKGAEHASARGTDPDWSSKCILNGLGRSSSILTTPACPAAAAMWSTFGMGDVGDTASGDSTPNLKSSTTQPV